MGGSQYTEEEKAANKTKEENAAAEKELDKELEGAAPASADPTVPSAPAPAPTEPADPTPQKGG